ncbi:MAG: helix-turn-helix transcriptional regulator [Patescibacteria group bacterium]
MGDEIDVHLGRRLRRRRKFLDLTQQELADACGVRFQQIQKYECGANRMSAARLWGFAGVLGVSPQYFYEGLASSRSTSEERSLTKECLMSSETQELVTAFSGIDELLRRRLVELAKAMASRT